MPPSGQSDALHCATPLSQSQELLFVLNTPKGRGIFAARDIAARTLIEVSPVLIFDDDEYEKHIRKTRLLHYTYNWPTKITAAAATSDCQHTAQSALQDPHTTVVSNTAPLGQFQGPPPPTPTATPPRHPTPPQVARLKARTVLRQALPLGLGAIFNHSRVGRRQHNVGWTRDLQAEVIRYVTLRDVFKGEELCICYGERLCFSDVDGSSDEGGHEQEQKEVTIEDESEI